MRREYAWKLQRQKRIWEGRPTNVCDGGRQTSGIHVSGIEASLRHSQQKQVKNYRRRLQSNYGSDIKRCSLSLISALFVWLWSGLLWHSMAWSARSARLHRSLHHQYIYWSADSLSISSKSKRHNSSHCNCTYSCIVVSVVCIVLCLLPEQSTSSTALL